MVAALICMRVFVLDWIWISGESMLPGLSDGELVLAEKISRQTSGAKRGDVVIVNYPDGLQCVKRVIGEGGDVVSIRGNAVYVNGAGIEEPYVFEPAFADMEETLVPAGHVFVMGDNRNYSSDSRNPEVGAIPRDKVVAHAICVIYPFDKVRKV